MQHWGLLLFFEHLKLIFISEYTDVVEKYTIVFTVFSSRFLCKSDHLASGLKASRYRNPNRNFHRRWKEIKSYPLRLCFQFSYQRSSEVLLSLCLNNGFVVLFYLRKLGSVVSLCDRNRNLSQHLKKKQKKIFYQRSQSSSHISQRNPIYVKKRSFN